MSEIHLKRYNYDTNSEEDLGTVSTYTLARCMSEKQFTEFFSDFLNLGGKDFRVGELVGLDARSHHRTLQGLMVRFCLGVIIGISKQEYTDARNAAVVALGKKLKAMLDNEELNMGHLI